MLLFQDNIVAHTQIIRGVQYNVFSVYTGPELIYDRVGAMIENAFTSSNPLQITKSSLVDSDIATADD